MLLKTGTFHENPFLLISVIIKGQYTFPNSFPDENVSLMPLYDFIPSTAQSRVGQKYPQRGSGAYLRQGGEKDALSSWYSFLSDADLLVLSLTQMSVLSYSPKVIK